MESDPFTGQQDAASAVTTASASASAIANANAPDAANVDVPDTTSVDVLIVGQGIAGSVLAYTLMEAGFSVCVVDDGHKTSASTVAAGMINPVLGRRLSKAWEIEKCLPLAIGLYTRLEAHFGQHFFFPKRILRLIDSEKEAEYLQKRLADTAFSPYLGALHPPGTSGGNGNDTGNTGSSFDTDSSFSTGSGIDTDSASANARDASTPDATTDAPDATTDALRMDDALGSIEINGGGFLDTCALLTALRGYFVQQGSLVEAQFDHSRLDLGIVGKVRWGGITAGRIVFAEGWRILHNPLFAAYDFQPTRGQILTVQAEQPLPEHIINRSKWLIPQGGREAWLGSTYERGHTEATTTAEGRCEILGKVQSFLPNNRLSVIGQRAGIRLACRDFIPRAGFLPGDARIGIFNAFSSKANCFAPYLAQCMADHLRKGTPLPQQADISQKKTRNAQ